MGPALRKLALTAHVTASVGWLGAVAGFLALSIVGLTVGDADVVRGAYLSMHRIGLFVIVPLSLAALVTGLIQSLGTQWGLFRHYWVVVKLVLTIGAVLLLLLHQFTAVAVAAKRAAAAAGTTPDVGRLGVQLVADSAFAVVVLLVATALGIYKPWGMTRQEVAGTATTAGLPLGLKILLAVLAALLLAFGVAHLAGRGLGGHGP